MENKKRNLINRSNYYSSALTVLSLKRKEDYSQLKGSHVTFICTKDPFNKGEPIYTAKLAMDKKIDENYNTIIQFINVSAYNKVQDKELRAFMAYVDHEELSDTPLVQMINQQVKKLRNKEDWREDYMRIEDYAQVKIESTIEDAKAEARDEGIKYILKLIEILNNKFKLNNTSWLIHLNNAQLNEVELLANTINEKEEFEKQINQFVIQYNC